MTRVFILALIVGVASSCDQSKATAENKPADNTKKNERDRDGDTKTPLDQAENKADVAITANIRKAVVDDAALSTSAKNIKIITADGVVTLRGPIESEDERTKITVLANGTPDVKRVEDQLEVAAK